jgi:hypothetical protein
VAAGSQVEYEERRPRLLTQVGSMLLHCVAAVARPSRGHPRGRLKLGCRILAPRPGPARLRGFLIAPGMTASTPRSARGRDRLRRAELCGLRWSEIDRGRAARRGALDPCGPSVPISGPEFAASVVVRLAGIRGRRHDLGAACVRSWRPCTIPAVRNARPG